jgi:DNA invertase Pin-like site-specific DNA recombinase
VAVAVSSFCSSRAAVAELERSLIVERVCAGLRNARGKRLGSPLLAFGLSMIAIGEQMGVSAATICRRVKTLTN